MAFQPCEGAPRASYDAMRALGTVLEHEMQCAMQDVLLDLECARMEREDFRQGNGPAYLETAASPTMPSQLLLCMEL